MSSQHLSDEAVAAFADGVLRGHARERAARHTESCAECAHAVRVQREAVLALRAAPAPALPTSLADRLRTLPQTTPLNVLPTVVAEDGTTMLSTTGRWGGSVLGAPMAALVPSRPKPSEPRVQRDHRRSPLVTTAAVVALTGALTLGAALHNNPSEPGTGQLVRRFAPAEDVPAPMIAPVSLFRSGGH